MLQMTSGWAADNRLVGASHSARATMCAGVLGGVGARARGRGDPCHLHNDDIDHFNEGIFERRQEAGQVGTMLGHYLTDIEEGVFTVGRWRKTAAEVFWRGDPVSDRKAAAWGRG